MSTQSKRHPRYQRKGEEKINLFLSLQRDERRLKRRNVNAGPQNN